MRSGPFADPLCEQRLIGYGVDSACEPPVPRYAMVSPSAGCAADATVGEVREVAGRYEGTLYYFDPSTGTCAGGASLGLVPAGVDDLRFVQRDAPRRTPRRQPRSPE